MPMISFLRNEAFDPETIDAMSQAFSEVRRVLGLNDVTDQITGVVACRIIELAQQGVLTKSALMKRAMEEFKEIAH